MQACRWLLQGVVVYVFNVRGFAGGSQADLANNIAMLSKIWEAVVSLGSVPILLLGDFNMNILDSAVFRAASHSGWVVANLQGRAPLQHLLCSHASLGEALVQLTLL